MRVYPYGHPSILPPTYLGLRLGIRLRLGSGLIKVRVRVESEGEGMWRARARASARASVSVFQSIQKPTSQEDELVEVLTTVKVRVN